MAKLKIEVEHVNVDGSDLYWAAIPLYELERSRREAMRAFTKVLPSPPEEIVCADIGTLRLLAQTNKLPQGRYYIEGLPGTVFIDHRPTFDYRVLEESCCAGWCVIVPGTSKSPAALAKANQAALIAAYREVLYNLSERVTKIESDVHSLRHQPSNDWS